ncbi:Exosome complex component RRP45 [Armadillidium nasatum]|uniref:Exosome complex component RRP45 n=1 Tax=Armadillidium nasatum TaxID=96803 RepID=A0A5N5SNM8_9CRUS|nr:Exosome complex component RRP45 [Armadillidium nasatum]
MAAPHFEMGKGGEIIDEIQQILDRNIKESRCLDVESLCIMAEESVWQFKVDVTVLNHGGNLGDACNLAAVAALRHFHRPDVTVEEDGRVTIHTHEEKELIPTFLKKIPVCLTFALFEVEDDCITLIDPTETEERVMSGKLVVGLNPHGEITSLLFPGKLCLQKHHIMSCVSHTFLEAKSIAETVMSLVEDDLEKRRSSIKVKGFLNCLRSDSVYKKQLLRERIKNVPVMKVKSDVKVKEESMEETGSEETCKEIVAESLENEQKEAYVDTSSDEEFSQDLLNKTLPEIKKEKKKKVKSKTKKNKIKLETGCRQ